MEYLYNADITNAKQVITGILFLFHIQLQLLNEKQHFLNVLITLYNHEG